MRSTGAPDEPIAETTAASANGDLVTEPLASAREARRVRRASLLVLKGDRAGVSFPTHGERCVIGTHASADVRLEDDRAVSRFHCEIALGPTGATIRDLESRNGTFVDGVRIGTAHLHDKAILTVGATELRFSLGAEDIALPLSERTALGSLVGVSTAMRQTFARLELAARAETSVLITGETGTGKEAAAEALHTEGPRRDGPWVVVDCSALAPSILESELFGHERGAFTGAATRRAGAFEAADGGTVFLDEIGELPLDLQPKLLRVLEQRQVRRLGATQYVPLDVRVVAATNRDLREEVNARRFRSDLYYRLAVVEIAMPALRSRPEDIPLLVEHILSRRLRGAPRPAFADDPSVLSRMQRYGWPGNVRELRNFVERALTLDLTAPPGDGTQAPAALDGGALEAAIQADAPFRPQRDAWTRAFENRYLRALMERHDDNVTAAARAADLDRVYLYRLLWKHGLR
ncbi:MAG: sigma 54-interacting transcriptional regulator [Sandaracinus sp.]